MSRLILVEDDRHLRYGLEFNLRKEGYAVRSFDSAEKGLAAWQEEPCDIFLLDIMLPGHSGMQMLEEIRSKDQSCAVVMLTARSDESDAVLALDLGADDYVRKPFGVSELMARLKRLLRRKQPESVATGRLGPWDVDLEHYRLRRGDNEVSLTSIEAAILGVLLAHPGIVVPREELLAQVWGEGMSNLTRTLDNHVARLRRKVEDTPSRPELILTVHGIGYRAAP